MYPLYRPVLSIAVGLLLTVGSAATAAAAAAPGAPEPAVVERSPVTAPAGPDHVLSVFGAGPYRFGASLPRLSAAGLIDSPVPDPVRPELTVATSTGEWAGELLLVFRRNRLIEIETATDTVRTFAGARVGMSFDELEQIYGRHGRMITNDAGRQAYLVRVGPMVLLFGDHPIRPGVGSIEVGPAAFTLREFELAGR